MKVTPPPPESREQELAEHVMIDDQASETGMSAQADSDTGQQCHPEHGASEQEQVHGGLIRSSDESRESGGSASAFSSYGDAPTLILRGIDELDISPEGDVTSDVTSSQSRQPCFSVRA